MIPEDKYTDDSHLSFSWDQFYSLPEDFRERVITVWECEYSGKDVDSSTSDSEGALVHVRFDNLSLEVQPWDDYISVGMGLTIV